MNEEYKRLTLQVETDMLMMQDQLSKILTKIEVIEKSIARLAQIFPSDVKI